LNAIVLIENKLFGDFSSQVSQHFDMKKRIKLIVE